MAPTYLEKIAGLVRLAADPRTPHHEASAAALAACRRIHEQGLLTGGEVAQPIQSREGVLVSNTFFLLFERDDVLGLVEIGSSYRVTGMSRKVIVPKPVIIELSWMTDEERDEKYIGITNRVTQRLIVDRNWWMKCKVSL